MVSPASIVGLLSSYFAAGLIVKRPSPFPQETIDLNESNLSAPLSCVISLLTYFTPSGNAIYITIPLTSLSLVLRIVTSYLILSPGFTVALPPKSFCFTDTRNGHSDFLESKVIASSLSATIDVASTDVVDFADTLDMIGATADEPATAAHIRADETFKMFFFMLFCPFYINFLHENITDAR